MRIVWDEPKRLANLAKHGFDFADFETGFSFDRYLAFPARASRTGRTRYRLVGTLFGEPVVVAIVSPLGFEAVSIVSLRIANVKERAAYDRA
jgi:uncharacterized DUF497 family protein